MIIISDKNYVIRKIQDGFICWNCYSGMGVSKDGDPKELIDRFQGIDQVASLEACNLLIDSAEAGSKLYFIMSKAKIEGTSGNSQTHKVVFRKKSDSQEQDPYSFGGIGNARYPQEYHPFNLLQMLGQQQLEQQKQHFEMMMKVKDLEEKGKPDFTELLAIEFVKGNVEIKGFKSPISIKRPQVAGQASADSAPAPAPPQQEQTVQESLGLSNERRAILEESVGKLLQAEPDLPELLAGLHKYISDPRNSSTYQVIKMQLLNG